MRKAYYSYAFGLNAAGAAVVLEPTPRARRLCPSSPFPAETLRGRPKAEALRDAKLRAMARNPEFAKPFYWSAFVLVGDRR